jgi:hypothetical protein
MCARILAVLATLIGAVGSAAAAVQVSGTVYADKDGDGVLSAAPVAGVAVVWETTVVAMTDAHGRYTLSVPSDGIIWVRTPDGYAPTPSWRAVRVADGDAAVDLALAPAAAKGPVVFVDGADSHLGLTSGDAAAFALKAAAGLTPPPHFLTIVGDLTDRPSTASSKRSPTRVRASTCPSSRSSATTTGRTAAPPTASTSVRRCTASTAAVPTSSCST